MCSGLDELRRENRSLRERLARLFEHLRGIERPFQLEDQPGYFASQAGSAIAIAHGEVERARDAC